MSSDSDKDETGPAGRNSWGCGTIGELAIVVLVIILWFM